MALKSKRLPGRVRLDQWAGAADSGAYRSQNRSYGTGICVSVKFYEASPQTSDGYAVKRLIRSSFVPTVAATNTIGLEGGALLMMLIGR
jgi:hypothetical protein